MCTFVIELIILFFKDIWVRTCRHVHIKFIIKKCKLSFSLSLCMCFDINKSNVIWISFCVKLNGQLYFYKEKYVLHKNQSNKERK